MVLLLFVSNKMLSGCMPRARLQSLAGRCGAGGGCRTGCAGPWVGRAWVTVFFEIPGSHYECILSAIFGSCTPATLDSDCAQAAVCSGSHDEVLNFLWRLSWVLDSSPLRNIIRNRSHLKALASQKWRKTDWLTFHHCYTLIGTLMPTG